LIHVIEHRFCDDLLGCIVRLIRHS
jgi:hypothetical protein